MEELAKILKIVSKHTGVARTDILEGNTRKCTDARGIVCHLIMYGLPHLKRTFIETSARTTDAFYKSAHTADMMVRRNPEYRYTVNCVRRRLGLPPMKYEDNESVSATMRLFGFDYTDADILRREKAMHDSMAYMAKVCSEGRQPMEGAMVYSVIRKPDMRQWYHDNV